MLTTFQKRSKFLEENLKNKRDKRETDVRGTRKNLTRHVTAKIDGVINYVRAGFMDYGRKYSYFLSFCYVLLCFFKQF